jgi:hypothetical protein
MRLRFAALSTLVRHQDTLADDAISLLKRPDYRWINVIGLINANVASDIMTIGELVRAEMPMAPCRYEISPIRLSNDTARIVEQNTLAKRMCRSPCLMLATMTTLPE